MKMPALLPGQKVAVGGGALALVGSVLPWVRTANGAFLGFEIDGFLTLMAAVSVLGIATLWEWRWLPMLGVTLFGGIITAITANTLITLGEASGATDGAIDAGVGAYLVLFAGVLIAGSGVYGLLAARRTGGNAGERPEERPDAE